MNELSKFGMQGLTGIMELNTTLLDLLFGNTTGVEYIAFIFFTLFGMFYIKLASYIKQRKRQIGFERTKFSCRRWLDENILDFVLAFMTAFGLFRFFPDAFSFIKKFHELPEFTDKMAYGLLLGLAFQYLFHKWFGEVTVVKTVQKIKDN